MYAGAIDGPGGAEGGANAVPPPRRRTSADMGKDGAGEYPASGSGGGAVKGAHNNRPAGIVMCSSCKTTNSPEWRKGPSGKKELCNAYVTVSSSLSTRCLFQYTFVDAAFVMPVRAPRRIRNVM